MVFVHSKNGNTDCKETQDLPEDLLTGCIFCCISKQPGAPAQAVTAAKFDGSRSPRVTNATPHHKTECCHLSLHNISLAADLEKTLGSDLNHSPPRRVSA